jgi:hypothetical protein
MAQEDRDKIEAVLNMFKKDANIDVLGAAEAQTAEELFVQ